MYDILRQSMVHNELPINILIEKSLLLHGNKYNQERIEPNELMILL